MDLSHVRPLASNAGLSFGGVRPDGAFDVPDSLAQAWLKECRNQDEEVLAKLLRPYIRGSDIVQRHSGTWLIDSHESMGEAELSRLGSIYQYLLERVQPARSTSRRPKLRSKWWQLSEPRSQMRQALDGVSRYIATPQCSKHRIFVWVEASILPDMSVVVIAREDDTTFGILQSRFHEIWSNRLGNLNGIAKTPRYSRNACFETFPFPKGLSPNVASSITATDPRARDVSVASRNLVRLREAWLNPPELVTIEPDLRPDLPVRCLPKDAYAATELSRRTLTSLYNEVPRWLHEAHQELDETVAHAYGWPASLTDEEVFTRLVELNAQRQMPPVQLNLAMTCGTEATPDQNGIPPEPPAPEEASPPPAPMPYLPPPDFRSGYTPPPNYATLSWSTPHRVGNRRIRLNSGIDNPEDESGHDWLE